MKRFFIVISVCFGVFLLTAANTPVKTKKVIIEGKVKNISDKSAETITAIECNDVILIPNIQEQTFVGSLQNSTYPPILNVCKPQLYNLKYRNPPFWYRDSIHIR